MKELYRFRQFLTEGVIKENISSHKEEAKRFLEKFVDDNEDKFEFIPDLETGYIDANDNSYNVDELASIFLDIGQDIPRGTHNQKYKGEGGTYVVVSEGVIKEEQMGSYGKFLKVVKSYEDEEILSDFLDSYPKGQDISKSEYERFTEKHLGLSDPEDYRGENWKYIMSEGKLLKEVMDEEMVDYVSAMYDSDVDQEAEEGFQSDVWSKAQYASNAYNESSIFLELIDHLKSVGGKDVVEGNPDIELELLPNGDIRWSANVTHY